MTENTEKVEEIIKSGVKKVRLGDREIEYRTLAELERIKAKQRESLSTTAAPIFDKGV